jgi:hypothetical protein
MNIVWNTVVWKVYNKNSELVCFAQILNLTIDWIACEAKKFALQAFKPKFS